MKTSGFVSIFALLCLAAFASAQTKKPPDMQGLLIYGKGFVFAASEPEGWNADTDKIAREYKVNVIFLPQAKDSRKADVTIRVRINSKQNEDPQDDMEFDMNSYRKEYPNVTFADLTSKHPNYKTSARLFFERNKFYEYVAYIYPGSESKLMFSVAMSKEKSPATEAELEAFNHVLNSLLMMGNVKVNDQK